VGREKRLFDRYQKIAINHRYHGCAAHNCDRPPAWVEFHHLDPWSRGGATDAKNGISLCPPHHHLADHPETYDMRRLPDGKVRFSRRT
jgi:predicted restriction endonuclease